MPGKQLVCGIDIGTTGTKAALFDASGRQIAEGHAEHPTSHLAPGWAEQDPDDWWRSLCAATRAMIDASGVDAGAIAAVAISAQAPTLLPLDASLRPVRPALIWMDRRADAQARLLADEFGEREIVALTGNRADPFYVAPKILWMRHHEPDLFARTRWFAQINGWAASRLTGALTMDPVHAALLGLRRWPGAAVVAPGAAPPGAAAVAPGAAPPGAAAHVGREANAGAAARVGNEARAGREIRAGDSRVAPGGDSVWVDELCRVCGVEPDRFPRVAAGHEVIGEVSRAAAAECGLAAGTPVVAGTVDGSAAALEAGALAPGIAAEMTGTSTVLLMPNDEGAASPAFIAMPQALPEGYLLLGAMSTTGASLGWLREQISSGGVSYERLVAEAEAVEPGAGGVIFLPYMAGERSPIWSTNARGVFFGLSLSTGRGELVRAVLEGAAFALRHNVECAREAGVLFDAVRSVGGGAASALWNQIKSDVLGLPILVPERALGAPFGDALLASIGCGLMPASRTRLSEMNAVAARFEPEAARVRRYGERYRLYRALYERLKGLFDEAAADAAEAEHG